MPGKCFTGLTTLVYIAGSVLPLAAQQGPGQFRPTPIPVQSAAGPDQPSVAPKQPSPGQPVIPRRVVPQPAPSANQPRADSAATDGAGSQAEPAAQPQAVPPERKLLPPPRVPSGTGGMVSLNFNRADLVEIIHILAQHLRLTYTIDPEVKGTVTIHSAEPLRQEDLLPIFHQVLRMNGAVAVRTGNIYRIMPIKDGKGLVRPIGQAREDSFALQIVPVRFFAVAEMKKLLTPFLTPGGELIENGRGNFLIIIDLPSNVQRLVEIADMIDIQVFAGTRMEVYRPKVASAEELAAEMTKVMQHYAASSPQPENFAAQFVPLPRINQLLVISHSDAAWTYAQRWLERIDVVGEGPGRRIFIYPVENGKATELAEVLSLALGHPSIGTRGSQQTLQSMHRSTPGGSGQSGFGQFGGGRSSASPFGSTGPYQQQSQPMGGAFATIPATPQVSPTAPPAAPGVAPGLAPVPGAPRAAAPTSPGVRPDEQLRIVPDPGTNSLIIYGTVQEFQNIRTILKELDLIPRQVLMDVMVVEVSLTDDLRFGIDYEILRKGGDVRIFNREFGSRGGIISGATPPAASSGLTSFGLGLSGVIGTGDAVRAFINTVASDSRVKVLSHPSVLATDNRPARIQVGSEEPVPTGTITQTVGTIAESTSIQYRNTGRIVTIIPQVNSQGLVNLQILAEVSQRGLNVAVGPNTFPSFDIRQAETTAVVQDGESLVIGGIISERKSQDRTGVPFLMNLPVLGRFFGTTTDEADRTELIMLITPHVIRSREEARYVSEDFKSKLSAARNEVERYRLEQEKLQQQRQLPPALIPQSTVPGPGASNRSMLPHRSSAPLKKPADQSAATLAIQDAAKAKRAQPSAAAMTELTNRNTPLPQPASPFQAPAEPGQAAQPMQLARQPEHPKSIPSALSVQVSEPTTQTEQPAASQPVPGNSIRPENSAGASAQGAAGREPAPKAKSVWMVQVASLPQEKEADNMAGLLRQQGYDVFVLSAEVDSKLRYRVRVGQLGTEREAVELQNALKAGNNFADSFVTRTMARQIAP